MKKAGAILRTADGFPRFSEEEYRRRFGLVREMMDREGVEALIVHGGAGGGAPIHYLTNYPAGRPTWLLFPAEGPSTLFLYFQNHAPCTRAMTIADEVTCFWPSAPRALAGKMREQGLDRSRLGVVGLAASIPYAQFSELRALLPDADFVDVSRRYNEIRWVRSPEEMLFIRKAADLSDRACALLAERIRPGLSEHELEALIHEAFLPEGGQLGIAFLSTTSMTDPARFVPWQFLTPRRLEKGDVVITELTVTFWGYGGQIHRPFAVGVEPTDLYRRLFEVARECFEAVRGVLRDGATSEDVVEAGGIVEKRGFLLFDSLVHGEGGRNPELGASGSGHSFEPWTFRENQIMVIQPNPITADRTAGLQLGSAVRVGPNGAEPLHTHPWEFHVCG
jgi:Xaa-Pro dipeptidase